MKRIVCPSCGLVNLEKFTTFPYCAACGKDLPQNVATGARQFWTQPIRPAIFAVSLGVGAAILGLGAVTVARDTRDRWSDQMVVYAHLPRRVNPDGLVHISFSLDSTQQTPPSQFEDVTLRIPSSVLKEVQVVSVMPSPGGTEKLGGGHYFFWSSVSPTTPLRLTLRPRYPGELRFPITVSSRDFGWFHSRLNVNVEKETLQKAKARGKAKLPN